MNQWNIPKSLICLLILFLTLLAFIAPLNNGFAIGGDDQFELGKASLLHRTPELSLRLNNDQPWLNTIIIAKAFNVFGENAAVPRLFNLLLFFSLVFGIWTLAGKRYSVLFKVAFLCYFITANEVAILAISAMLEPSALAFAVLAIAFSWKDDGNVVWWRSYLAGILFAMAVFTKLTALLVIPAWCVLIFWGKAKRVERAISLLRMLLSFICVMLIVIIISPTFSFDSMWISHQKASQIIKANSLSGNEFDISNVFHEWSVIFAIALGVIGVVLKRNIYSLRITLFAIVWLLTDFIVFANHRPWWGYYSFHFHIPIAILAAQGADFVIREAWKGIACSSEKTSEPSLCVFRKIKPITLSNIYAVLAATVIACWIGFRLPPLWKEIDSIHSEENARDNEFIPIIQTLANKVKWIYISNSNIGFHCGVQQPPELIIRTYKRIITGELSKNGILEIIKLYHPELLLLSRTGEMKDERFLKILDSGHYKCIMWTANYQLWAAGSLHLEPAKTPTEIVHELRI